jgi:conjugative relaxase-like TrwC/TraI family protein
MLRVTVIASAARAESYYIASAQYYHGEELLPSRWPGKGAQQLGLHGEVAPEQFSALVRNRDSFTGERITSADRENRRVAYDFTFSVSKSISVQALLAQDDRILKAFRESVEDTMRLVEQDAAVRVRAGGKDEDRRVGNLTFATFYHGLTRPVGEEQLSEPQLHARVVCLNMAHDEQEQ